MKSVAAFAFAYLLAGALAMPANPTLTNGKNQTASAMARDNMAMNMTARAVVSDTKGMSQESDNNDNNNNMQEHHDAMNATRRAMPDKASSQMNSASQMTGGNNMGKHGQINHMTGSITDATDAVKLIDSSRNALGGIRTSEQISNVMHMVRGNMANLKTWMTSCNCLKAVAPQKRRQPSPKNAGGLTDVASAVSMVDSINGKLDRVHSVGELNDVLPGIDKSFNSLTKWIPKVSKGAANATAPSAIAGAGNIGGI